MNDKEIKELLRHEYPEFDNKGNEIYELVSNKRKRPFFTRKMILMPVASVIIALLVVLVFTFSGNKGFKKICDGVYVSASTLDLSGEVDMSICEGIVLEEQEFVHLNTDRIAPRRVNSLHGLPMNLFFLDNESIFRLYCSKGYISVLYGFEGRDGGIIDNNRGLPYASIQWSPFKSLSESQKTTDYNENLSILRKSDDTDLYILCTKNDLIIGLTIVHFDLYIPEDDSIYFMYHINGKITASYIFKDRDNNIHGITKKQLLMIVKQIKNGD
jgi:hypothetical protein